MVSEKIRVNLTFVVRFFIAKASGVTLALFLLCGALGILAYMMSDSSILASKTPPENQNALNAWDARIEPIATAFIPFLAFGALFFLAVSIVFTAVAVSSDSRKGTMRKVGIPKDIANEMLRDKKTAEEVSAAWNERNPNLVVTSFKQRFNRDSFSDLARCRREYRELHNTGHVTPESVSLMLIGFDLEDIVAYDNKVMLSAWVNSEDGDIRRAVALGRAANYDIDPETFGSFLNGDKLSMRAIA